MQRELNYNIGGVIGPDQRRFLALWLLQRMVFIVLPGVYIAIQVSGNIRWFFLIESTVLAFIFIWQYGLDVWQARVRVINGYLEKFRKRVRGPAHYYVLIDGVQIRSQKEIWQTLEAGRQYEVFYSPRSKWLLSYRNSMNDKDVAATSRPERTYGNSIFW